MQGHKHKNIVTSVRSGEDNRRKLFVIMDWSEVVRSTCKMSTLVLVLLLLLSVVVFF